MNDQAATGFVVLGGLLGAGRVALPAVAAAIAGRRRDPWVERGTPEMKASPPGTSRRDHEEQRKK